MLETSSGGASLRDVPEKTIAKCGILLGLLKSTAEQEDGDDFPTYPIWDDHPDSEEPIKSELPPSAPLPSCSASPDPASGDEFTTSDLEELAALDYESTVEHYYDTVVIHGGL